MSRSGLESETTQARIGVFGGTFNPIHVGHLRSAVEVREVQQLDRIVFVPSALPPHKSRAGLAPAEDRYAMVSRAIAGQRGFSVSRVEIDRPGPSYAIDTLELLRAERPTARHAFILGMDAFCEIGTWKKYRSLFACCDLIVTSRPPHALPDLRALLPVVARGDFCYGRSEEELIHASGHRVIFQRIHDLEISATELRRLCRQGRSLRFLVPLAVERYIIRHGLYGAAAQGVDR